MRMKLQCAATASMVLGPPQGMSVNGHPVVVGQLQVHGGRRRRRVQPGGDIRLPQLQQKHK
jgi:hypothetical protein